MDKKNHPDKKKKHKELTEEEIRKREKKIDEQLEQTFPASDPPSYSQPGNVPKEEE